MHDNFVFYYQAMLLPSYVAVQSLHMCHDNFSSKSNYFGFIFENVNCIDIVVGNMLLCTYSLKSS